MKAASISSFNPFCEKEAVMGIVPYMQRGEAIPSRLAGISPRTPSLFSEIPENAEWILSLAKTEMKEPRTMPSTQ